MAAGEAAPGLDGFAGDLFLALARDGKLVLDPAQAEQVIAELQRTLDVVHDRLRILASRPTVDHPVCSQFAVDALFADQIAPGQMERALDELPKYIRALRIAGRLPD
jgi:hypothetical protein